MITAVASTDQYKPGLCLKPPFFRKVDMEKGSLSTQKLIEKACGKKTEKEKERK